MNKKTILILPLIFIFFQNGNAMIRGVDGNPLRKYYRKKKAPTPPTPKRRNQKIEPKKRTYKKTFPLMIKVEPNQMVTKSSPQPRKKPKRKRKKRKIIRNPEIARKYNNTKHKKHIKLIGGKWECIYCDKILRAPERAERHCFDEHPEINTEYKPRPERKTQHDSDTEYFPPKNNENISDDSCDLRSGKKRKRTNMFPNGNRQEVTTRNSLRTNIFVMNTDDHLPIKKRRLRGSAAFKFRR